MNIIWLFSQLRNIRILCFLGAVAVTLGLIATIGASLPVQADSASFSLDRAVADALRTSDDLAFAAKQVEIDRSQTVIAGSRNLPSIGASAAATRYDGASDVSLPGMGAPIELLGTHSEDLWLSVALPLDVTGQVSASVRQSRIQTAVDELALQQQRNALVLRVKRVYYDVLRSEHRVRVAQSALESAAAQKELAAKLVAQEMGQKIDLRRADTQVAVAQQDLTRAQNDLEIARQTFNDLVGRPLSADVNLDDIPGVAMRSSQSESGTLFTAPAGRINIDDLNKDLDRAHLFRPDLLSADLSARASRIGVKLARVGLEPTVSLSAGAHYLPTTSFMMPRDRTAEVTVMVNVPLYDGGATRDRVQAAKAREAQSALGLDMARKAVDLSVRQAYYNVVSASGQIDSANTALQQALTARRLAQTRYEGQVGLYLEVTDSQAALVAAENNQVNAVYDYLLACSQLEYETGYPKGAK